MLPSNMLLLNLILQIDVTFSTPTDVIMRWGQDWGAHPGCPEVGFWEV
jgi:hypothetical protein